MLHLALYVCLHKSKLGRYKYNFFLYTVSALMQPQGFIFQNEFLVEVQFKKTLKKQTFQQQSGVLFEKKPQNRTFHIIMHYLGLYSSVGTGVALAKIRYVMQKYQSSKGEYAKFIAQPLQKLSFFEKWAKGQE